MMGVTALIGIVPKEGKVQTTLQSRAMTLPVSIVVGSNCR